VGEVMAKGKYEYWLTDDGLLLLAAWARDGLTDEQIAAKMGVCVATLYNYKKNHLEILEALKKGKEIADIEVENALFKRATGYTHKIVKPFMYQGEIIIAEFIEEVAPDVAAAFIWLKNRMPKKWRDKPIDMESGFNEINQNLQTLAEILQNPVPDRELPEEE